MALVAVLDVGGTHVTAAAVDSAGWHLVGIPQRRTIDSHADATSILDALGDAARRLDADVDVVWAVAMPDPFDYPAGIGRFHGVAKFEALHGVDVRGELAARLPRPRRIAFSNDADSFTVGEWVAGAAIGFQRVVGITLGTGIGSGWIDDGRPIDPGTPAGGRAHLLHVDGLPLEEHVSRRAIIRAYAATSGDASADVRGIAELARSEDPDATEVLSVAFRCLGRALAQPLRDFGAQVVVIGGSISRSWDLLDRWFQEGADDIGLPPVRAATDPDTAPLLGAAWLAVLEDGTVTPSR